MKNTENPLLKESATYNPRYENKHVLFARVIFADEKEFSTFKNENYGSRKKAPVWYRNGAAYTGIIDANPTAKLAEFSTTEISADGETWEKVSILAQQGREA